MSKEKKKFSQRLHEALDDMSYPRMGHGRQSALAKELKLSPQLIGGWLKGEEYPKTSQLVKISQFLNVRSNWLLSGSGSKYPKKNPALSLVRNKAEKAKQEIKKKENVVKEDNVEEIEINKMPQLDKEAFELALVWMKLPEQQREAIKKVIFELSLAGNDLA